MGSFSVETVVNVPADKVWAAAGDFKKSPGPSIKVTVEKEGDPGSNAVGCERSIQFGKNAPVRERLVAIDPPNSFTYDLFTPPVRSYTGKMEFIPEGISTRIRYKAVYKSKIPCTDWIVAIVAKKGVRMFINELGHR